MKHWKECRKMSDKERIATVDLVSRMAMYLRPEAANYKTNLMGIKQHVESLIEDHERW